MSLVHELSIDSPWIINEYFKERKYFWYTQINTKWHEHLLLQFKNYFTILEILILPEHSKSVAFCQTKLNLYAYLPKPLAHLRLSHL